MRAAKQIRKRVTEDNTARRKDGRVAPKVRVGIHTGDAIVGDSVNIAARLEQLSKEIGADSDAKILLSGETAMLAADRSDLIHHGHHEIRGRAERVEVWSLGLSSA